LIENIKSGKYSHVLLGPEQAVSEAFKDALTDPVFQSKVRLIAIDEYYLIQ
jgi:superfamily II DNA helicase RecQ